jgi:hypothetical protein
MENLNLDASQYTPQEVMKLFSLTPGYSPEDVANAGKKLVKQVEKTVLSPVRKASIEEFINNCEIKLADYGSANYQDPNAGTWAQKYNTMYSGTGSHAVIEEPRQVQGKTSSLVAMDNDGSPGYINPFEIKSLTRGVNIDSRFRKNYYGTTSSSFTVDLPEPIKKVKSMTVAATDIPMTAYAVDLERGDSTFLITMLTNTDLGYMNATNEPKCSQFPATFANFASQTEYQSGTYTTYNGAGVTVDWTYDSSGITVGPPVYLQAANSQIGNPSLGTPTAELVMGGQSTFVPQVENAVPAWLVTLPDGLYELSWQSASDASPLETILNNAISLSMPGLLDVSSGLFYRTQNFVAPLNAGKDICFVNDQTSGKGIFTFPQFGAGGYSGDGTDEGSNNKSQIQGNNNWSWIQSPITSDTVKDNLAYIPTVEGANGDKVPNAAITNQPNDNIWTFFINGFQLIFTVDSEGHRNLEENIMMRLGWKLGYRLGTYRSFGGPSLNIEAQKKYFTSASVMSEGITQVTPPRYVYISIDDGNRASSNSFTVTFAESTVDQNIIARLNYAAEVNANGAYQIASGAGLDNAMNRTRQYFGPVDITRLTFRLIDEYGRLLSLNNMDWSLTLSFEQLYD